MKYLILILLFSIQTQAKEQWFCTDDQATREGNSYAICGVGTDMYEGDARQEAMKKAKREFQEMCRMSSDCKKHSISVMPKRSTCFQQAGMFTCHRLFIFTVEN